MATKRTVKKPAARRKNPTKRKTAAQKLQSAIFKKANELMREGYERAQAFAVAYREKGEPRKGGKPKTMRSNPALVHRYDVQYFDQYAEPHHAQFHYKKDAVEFAKNKIEATIHDRVLRKNVWSNTIQSQRVQKNPVASRIRSRPKTGKPTKRIYTVEMASKKEGPYKTEGIFPTAASAKEYAHALDAKHNRTKYIRVTV